jgi:hypothetical protein
MAWIKRNESGAIVSAFMNGPCESEGATEQIADTEQELRDFLLAPAIPRVLQISDRQFFQMLALTQTITQTEALDAVKVGAIPAPLQAMVDAIEDGAARFAAEMLLSGATNFRRDHPLTEQIGAAQGMTAEQIDEFFTAAAQL